MDLASILYLGVTFGLFVIFVLIFFHTYSKKRKEQEIGRASCRERV